MPLLTRLTLHLIRAQLLWLRPVRPEFPQPVLSLEARRQATAMLLDVREEPRCIDDPHVCALFGDGATHPRGMFDPVVTA